MENDDEEHMMKMEMRTMISYTSAMLYLQTDVFCN